MPKSKFVKAIMFLLCLPMLVVGWVTLLQQIQFAAHSVTTTATVVGYEMKMECRKSGCSSFYPAKVRFTTADGQEIRTTLTNARNRTRPVEGQTISIKYRSDEPSIAHRPEDAFYIWRIPALMVFFGGLCAGYVLYSFFDSGPRKPTTLASPAPRPPPR